MQTDKKKSKIGLILLIIFSALIIIAGAITFVFFNQGGLELLAPRGEAAKPFVADGKISAIALNPDALFATGEEVSEASIRNQSKTVAAYAKENEFNTIVFKGKDGIVAYWYDLYFPRDEKIINLDGFFEKVDPLLILCEEANAAGIQVLLEINPYSSNNYKEGMKGKVAKHLQDANFAKYFSAEDDQYATLLTESLSRLPHKYPIAGIVFSQLNINDDNIVKDTSAWRTSFEKTIKTIKLNWKQAGYTQQIHLAFLADATSLITPEFVDSNFKNENIQTILPQFKKDISPSESLDIWANTGAPIIVTQEGSQEVSASENGLFLFTAATYEAYNGTFFKTYPLSEGTQNSLGTLRSALTPPEEPSPLPKGFIIPQELAVNYPAAGEKIRTSGLFIMGTSNPELPLLLDGLEVEPRSKSGAFGVAVALEFGKNTFTFSQGEVQLPLEVERPQPIQNIPPKTKPPEETEQEEVEEPAMPQDSTVKAEQGQAVQVVTQIASALTKHSDDSSVNETFPKGAVLIVEKSVPTVRWNSKRGRNEQTWAYMLSSGDYILARNCTWVGAQNLVFSGITGTAADENRGEWLTLFENATPAAYASFEDNTLNLTFYNIQNQHPTPENLNPASFSTVVTAANATADEKSTVIQLKMADNFWGYMLDYSEGKTRVFIKKAPALSENKEKPLENVHIIIDPGHGETDVGAPGLMGANGPNEKDLNLALAQTITYRLRQLGANVTLTRTDDTFPSLESRLDIQNNLKPDFFVSVHHNSAELVKNLNSASGAQVYYYHPYDTPKSKEFGQNIINNVAPATGRGGGDARWGYYYVTRTTVCPSVLFEYGFVVNPLEFEDISSKDGIYAAACATADGILQSVPPAA